MIPVEVEKISLFIDKLAKRAHLDLFGEKPLAVLAAVEYVYSGFLEGRPDHDASLTELLMSTITSNAIKRKFTALAEKTGKLKAPVWSWSNVVSSKRELIEVLTENKSVDEAFRNLTKEKASNLLRNYYEKLSLKRDLE